ncbi:hypothetical protein HMPREF6745_2909 [Prevotella sp. oral taxon 472 str. F0295]|nr:hypothetical protein HMPREF6745_2909 [Prevotella sp. oral taxon 472 str. F0295]
MPIPASLSFRALMQRWLKETSQYRVFLPMRTATTSKLNK